MPATVRDRTARARIRDYLAENGPVVDPAGRATSALKDAVDYRGSAVAFIQLLTAMDRESELIREIRGKRTYSVSAPPGVARSSESGSPSSAPRPHEAESVQLDYNALAQALVREVFRVLTSESEVTGPVKIDVVRAERDQLKDERDDYARKLEMARRQLGLLIDAGSLPAGQAAVEAQGRVLLAQLADQQIAGQAEAAS